MTGLTAEELQALFPHVAQACVTSMRDRTMDGQLRTSRRYRTDETCPLPTIADKLLCILTSLKQNPIQAIPGHLLGMSQSHANTWEHLLHAVLHQA